MVRDLPENDVMTVRELIDRWKRRLESEWRRVNEAGQDVPILASQARLIQTVGGLHLYEFLLPTGVSLRVDVPVSIVPSDDIEPTEGVVLTQTGNRLLVQGV